MKPKWYAPLERLPMAPGLTPVVRFLSRPRTRAVLAWTALLIAAAVASYLTWFGYDEPDRPERTVGHVYIDFSGQWIMGRMMVLGKGPFLYNGEQLHQALRGGYPVNPRRVEAGVKQDADKIYDEWLIQSIDRAEVRGPLYPPIHALYFSPLGLLPPVRAYRILQAINLLLTFAVGFLVWLLTRGRIWAAVGAAAVMAWPGYNGALGLAQNSLLTLTLLLLGWLFICRGRPWLGGVAWGFLAFKPVWAAAFFLVPLVTGRWRVCVVMLLTGAALALATLPFVGWNAWLDWLDLGRTASIDYGELESWIFLSRDLQGLPRRWLTFAADRAVGGVDLLTNLIGLILWLSVPLLTAAAALWRRRLAAATDGPAAAFLMLGAFLSCFHFMYYDVLAAGLALCLLFAEPARFLRPARAHPPGHGGWLWNAAVIALAVLFFLLPHLEDGIDFVTNKGKINTHSPPCDTFCLLGLWALCGWWWLRAKDAAGQSAVDA